LTSEFPRNARLTVIALTPHSRATSAIDLSVFIFILYIITLKMLK